jgi:hypothetical protein
MLAKFLDTQVDFPSEEPGKRRGILFNILADSFKALYRRL